MGVNVVYAPVLDLATNPANPALGIRSFGDDPARGRPARRGDGPRAAVGRRGRRGQALPGSGRRGRRTPTTRSASCTGVARRARRRELAAVPGGDRGRGPAGDVGPRRGAGADRRPDLPATLSRAVMTGLLRDELGFDGVDDQRRARHAGARAGRRPGGRDHRRDPRRRSTCCCARRTATAQRRIEATLVRGRRAAACSTPDELAASSARLAALRSLARRPPGRRPTSTSSAAADAPGALARARGAVADARSAAMAEPPPIACAARHADPRGHARHRPT